MKSNNVVTTNQPASARKRSRPITLHPTLQKATPFPAALKRSSGTSNSLHSASALSTAAAAASPSHLNIPRVIVREIAGEQLHSAASQTTGQFSPQSYLLSLYGHKCVRPCLEVQNFFIQHTQEQIDSYDFDVIQAVRNQDIDALRDMHKAGRPLQCANRFGESLIHMACRRVFVDVVYFLVNEANVSVKVRDDYGRTVLHDACWTVEPNEELVEFLIEQCPELLLMSDKRGNAPFEYVRSEHWDRWVKFLSQRKSFLCLGPLVAIG